MTEQQHWNAVFIATSMDGFIAGKDGDISWLDTIPIPEGTDMGYHAFMDRTDAILMGRISFETVLGFGIDWPYAKPVFVWSRRSLTIPDELQEKVFPIQGRTSEVLSQLHALGHRRLYIDGGMTIQSFLKEDLIDEMIITTIPVVLGEGISLFGELHPPTWFSCVQSQIFADAIVQSHYIKNT